MTSGDRIRKRRLELGLTQEEVATRLGFKHKSSINKIEKGIHDLSETKIVAIANALDTTPSYIMGWDDDEELGKSEKPNKLQRFTELIDGLSEEEQERLYNIIKLFLEQSK